MMFAVALFRVHDEEVSYHGLFKSKEEATEWLVSGGGEELDYHAAEIIEIEEVV